MKLDFLIIINFNRNFSFLSAEEFIKKIIHKKTSCRFLYVSKNFRFGFKRKGNIETLKKFEKHYNFKNLGIDWSFCKKLFFCKYLSP